MNESLKREVVKKWFGIDRVLFGDKDPKDVLSAEDRSKYLTTKGSLLANLAEMYHIMDFQTESVNYKSEREFFDACVTEADEAIKRSKTLLTNESVLKMVREEVKEVGELEQLTEEQVARYVVLKRKHATAIDSMLHEKFITKENRKKLSDWKGKVIVEAYKHLRNALIDLSM